MAEYVSNESWVRTVGRPDAIDDVADQFERPAPGAEAFWTSATKPRGWRPRVAFPERRAS